MSKYSHGNHMRERRLPATAQASDNEKGSLDAAGFSIKPAQKTIAPVDFEKFVLQGTLPETIVPDVYRGVVIVASDKDLAIPVILVVTPP